MTRLSSRTTRPGSFGAGAHVAFIDKGKISAFQKLFRRIQNAIGDYESTRRLLRMSNDQVSDLNKGRNMSVMVGKRIMSTYNDLKRKGDIKDTQ